MVANYGFVKGSTQGLSGVAILDRRGLSNGLREPHCQGVADLILALIKRGPAERPTPGTCRRETVAVTERCGQASLGWAAIVIRMAVLVGDVHWV